MNSPNTLNELHGGCVPILFNDRRVLGTAKLSNVMLPITSAAQDLTITGDLLVLRSAQMFSIIERIKRIG